MIILGTWWNVQTSKKKKHCSAPPQAHKQYLQQPWLAPLQPTLLAIAEWRKKGACCLIWAKHKYIDGEPGWCCWELKDIYGAAHMVLETFGGMEIYKLIGGEEP